MSDPLKPKEMSDEAWDKAQRLIARLELKYQDKLRKDTA
jgi:hypothetical protein